MTKDNLFRPAWTPLTIFLMIVGFIVFWPLGLAMLGYILYGDRLYQMWDEKSGPFSKRASTSAMHRCRTATARYRAPSGNIAFDEFRQRELARLEEERNKLDAMREDFDTYVRDLQRARDKEEFDRFMRQRTASEPNNLTTGDTFSGDVTPPPFAGPSNPPTGPQSAPA